MSQRYRTGDRAPANAWYDWDGYTDGTYSPSPMAEERRIPLEKGETFPPVRSCNKAAYWVLSSYR